jgi:AcrR family transcriptional regulator
MPEAKNLRDLRRAQIIAVGRSLVSEGGLEALTIGALEKRLSFSRGVITYHFEGKDDIVEAVLMSAIEEIDGATVQEIEAGATFAQKTRAMLGATVGGFLRSKEAAQIVVAFWGRIPQDARATKVNAALYGRYRKAAAKLIEEGRKSGEVRADVEVKTMAAVYVAAVIGVVTQAYFEPGAIDPKRAIDEAASAVLAHLEPRKRKKK